MLRIVRNNTGPAMTAHTGYAAATIAALARPPALHALTAPAQTVVIAIRLCALAARGNADPMAALALHLQNCEAACALNEFVRTVTRTWPERFAVGRACCQRLSPDEATLAALVQAGAARDRESFNRAIEGFIRPDRHEALWDACTHAVVLMR
jgi:hypothetical protein